LCAHIFIFLSLLFLMPSTTAVIPLLYFPSFSWLNLYLWRSIWIFPFPKILFYSLDCIGHLCPLHALFKSCGCLYHWTQHNDVLVSVFTTRQWVLLRAGVVFYSFLHPCYPAECLTHSLKSINLWYAELSRERFRKWEKG
jgi:hypothetical protein